MDEDIPLPFDLPAVARKEVSAAFDGGRITSDGGVIAPGPNGTSVGHRRPTRPGDPRRARWTFRSTLHGSVRMRCWEPKTRTLTNLYNERPAWLDNAHRDLDAAVAAAYGWPADLSEEEALARLLALNLERAAGG